MRIEPEQMWGYFEWLFFNFGLLQGVLVAVALAALGFIACYLVSMARYGPGEGFYHVTRVIYELLARDLPGTSWHRIYALSRLAFQEAIRRRVLVVMAVFIVGILFAGWFLDPGSDNVAGLYISFVMTGTSYLILLLGLFLSCFSLPADVKNKTIQTITTKPVRSTEIVLGRIFGFTAVGTVLLAGMAFLSYQFVTRGVTHQHEVKDVASDGLSGTSTYDAKHQHTFELLQLADGSLGGTTDEVKGHRHEVLVSEVDGKRVITLDPPEGLLGARIPVFGSLQITDRSGNIGEGLNVGYESEYQKYIEGNSLMSAIWTFDNVRPSRFDGGDALPLELSLQAFRTFKGDIVTGVQGEIILKNPNGRVESERRGFIVKEFAVDHIEIPRKLSGSRDGQPVEVDIFDDLVSEDGQLQVVVRCTDGGQYFGMAQPDLYLRAGDSTFGWNMFKGFLGIWMQMVLVICLGVMFSTFLSGPVAMVATMTCLMLGFFGNLALDVATGDMPGGGPIESLIRMPLQTGAMVDLDLGNKVLETVIKGADQGIMYTLVSVFQAIPRFGQFNTADFVAYGFNISGGLVARHLTMTLAYFVLTSLIAYFFLKTRELAAA